MSLEEQMIARWGEKDYFTELKKFYAKHKDCSYIEYDNQLNCPIRAVYRFMPYLTFLENEKLKEEIRNINKE